MESSVVYSVGPRSDGGKFKNVVAGFVRHVGAVVTGKDDRAGAAAELVDYYAALVRYCRCGISIKGKGGGAGIPCNHPDGFSRDDIVPGNKDLSLRTAEFLFIICENHRSPHPRREH